MKLITVLLLVIGFCLLLSAPWVLPSRQAYAGGHSAKLTRARRMKDAQTMVWYTGAIAATFLAAGICSIVVVRKAKSDYRVAASENLRRLIEGTSEDQRRKQNEHVES